MSKHNYNFSTHGICLGTAMTVLGFFIKNSFGNPLEMIHKLRNMNIIPPMWIFNILSYTFIFFSGICIGLVIENKYNIGKKEVSTYRGIVFLLCAYFLSILWYPVFFFAEKIFMSMIISALSMLFSLACTIEWSKLSPLKVSYINFASTIYYFYLLFINISIFINN